MHAWPFGNLHLDEVNWCCAFLFSRLKPSEPSRRILTTATIGSSGRKKEEAMTCCEERPRKSMKSWAPTIHLNIGFVVGVLFMLRIYLAVSQQAAIGGLSGNNE